MSALASGPRASAGGPLSFAPARRHRRPNLTPMIDVVFLLLVFFMLASRFGHEQVLPLTLAAVGQQGAVWSGPPRLVDLAADGPRLNGRPVALDALAAALAPLMSGPDDAIVLRARDGARLQDLASAMDTLRRAGFGALVLAE